MDTNTAFNADEFMQATVDAPMETEYQLCPEGSYEALVDDFDSKAFEQIDFTYKRGPKVGEPGSMTKFTLPWVIQDEAVKASMGRDKVVCSQQMLIDRTEQGGLDFGKDRNIELGRVRKALDQNGPGAWNFQLLKGSKKCVVQVKHENYERKDGTRGTTARVVRVTALR